MEQVGIRIIGMGTEAYLELFGSNKCAVKGATFAAIKDEKDNAKVVEFYEKNPSSLINSFELLDSKIVDVCPPKIISRFFPVSCYTDRPKTQLI